MRVAWCGGEGCLNWGLGSETADGSGLKKFLA